VIFHLLQIGHTRFGRSAVRKPRLIFKNPVASIWKELCKRAQTGVLKCGFNIGLIAKRAFTSVTIMVIPHDNFKALNLKVPVVALFVLILFMTFGGGYVLCLAVNGLQYKAQHQAMAAKVRFYSEQFYQWNSTLTGLRTAERKFRNIFSFRTKEEVLRYVDASSVSALDLPDLAQDLKKTITTVSQIKNYLQTQKDLYLATPMGFPVSGSITSNYGTRPDPMSGEIAFHAGIDISCGRATPIRATADGVVSHSGWLQGRGFAVIIDHGCGFLTLYAHNEMNTVKVGGKVKRGDVVGYVGSTGKSTGPHLHYEVWKDGRTINPQQYLTSRI